jgi:hypothetical protein
MGGQGRYRLAVPWETARAHLLQEWAVETRKYGELDLRHDVLDRHPEFMGKYQSHILAVARDPRVHLNPYYKHAAEHRAFQTRRRQLEVASKVTDPKSSEVRVSDQPADTKEMDKVREPEGGYVVAVYLESFSTLSGAGVRRAPAPAPSVPAATGEKGAATEQEKEKEKSRDKTRAVIPLLASALSSSMSVAASVNIEDLREMGAAARLSRVSRLVLITDTAIKSVTLKRVRAVMERHRHWGWLPPDRRKLQQQLHEARPEKERQRDMPLTGLCWEFRQSREFEVPWESNLCHFMVRMSISDILREFHKDRTVPTGWNLRRVHDPLIQRHGLHTGECGFILNQKDRKAAVCFVVPDDEADTVPYTSYEMDPGGFIRQEVPVPPPAPTVFVS